MATTLANINIKDKSSWNTYLNLIYPVGSYYISNTSTSPSSRFGGSWSQVTGRVLYANTSVGNYNAGTHTHGLSNGYAKIAFASSVGMFRKAVTKYEINEHWYPSDWQTSHVGGAWETTSAAALAGNSNSATNGLPARRDVYCWYRTA